MKQYEIGRNCEKRRRPIHESGVFQVNQSISFSFFSCRPGFLFFSFFQSILYQCVSSLGRHVFFVVLFHSSSSAVGIHKCCKCREGDYAARTSLAHFRGPSAKWLKPLKEHYCIPLHEPCTKIPAKPVCHGLVVCEFQKCIPSSFATSTSNSYATNDLPQSQTAPLL